MLDIVLTAVLVAVVFCTGFWFLFVSRRNGSDASQNADHKLDQALKDNRQELSASLKSATDSMDKRFASLQAGIEKRLINLQTVLVTNLDTLRQDNHKQLDRMRQTVDEKLQKTLESRLTESFKRVDRQLESVNKNMGEMQNLATGVGELQKTLSGVKTRGVWGEAHLANLLAETLNPEQYVTNFKPKKNQASTVEFALKIPNQNGLILYLPIDAKFPLTRFDDLQSALADNQVAQIDKARKRLGREIKTQAKSISTKYINPPVTTDFAIMYLPLESLYAEIAQQTDLVDELRRNYKITVAGPTTILPMLGMLGMGYRSLAIQKHVSEVWKILTETQIEFTKFGDLMDKAKKKLMEAGDTIDTASSKTRSIERKFKKVQRIEMEDSADQLSGNVK